jgi:hypothetical protein
VGGDNALQNQASDIAQQMRNEHDKHEYEEICPPK